MTARNAFKKKTGPLLAPSLLSAQFLRLHEEIQQVEKAGADWLHVDVMDGHFVPNLTFGPWIVETIRPITQLPLDCHLMVTDPEKWIPLFAHAGANCITVHAEATPHLNRVLQQIRSFGCQAGVSVNPATPVSQLTEVLDEIDLVLVMSVNPGFGGQKYIENSIHKVESLVEMRGSRDFLIEIDGGISPAHVPSLVQAGVDVFVAGSTVFGKKDRAKAVAEFQEAFSKS